METIKEVESQKSQIERPKTLPMINLVMIGVAFVVIVVGFALMVGEPSGATEYNPDIFSVRRITVGPMIALAGFIGLIVAILWRGKNKNRS